MATAKIVGQKLRLRVPESEADGDLAVMVRGLSMSQRRPNYDDRQSDTETVWDFPLGKVNALTVFGLICVYNVEMDDSDLDTVIDAGKQPTRQIYLKEPEYTGDVALYAVAWQVGVQDHSEVYTKVLSIPGRDRIASLDAGYETWAVPVSDEIAAGLVDLIDNHSFKTRPASLEASIRDAAARFFEKIQMSLGLTTTDLIIPGFNPKIQLMGYQKVGVALAAKHERVLLCDEPGLGKTYQALGTIQILDAFPALVVCPGIVRSQWHKQVPTALPERTSYVATGKPYDLFGMDNADVIIVSYETLANQTFQKQFGAFRQVQGLKSVIFDESHYLKERDAQRSRRAADIASGVRVRMCLTGTPMMNRPAELENQLRVLDRLSDIGGQAYFRQRYCVDERRGWSSGATNLPELNRRLRGLGIMIRRSYGDVADQIKHLYAGGLPATTSVNAMPDDWAKEYIRVEHNLIGWIREKVLSNPVFMASIASLPEPERVQEVQDEVSRIARRMGRAIHLVMIEQLRQVAAKSKLAAAVEFITDYLDQHADDQRKLVVFFHHHDVARELARQFDGGIIIGGQADDVRQQVIKDFTNNPDTKLLFCSVELGVGVDLLAGKDELFIELNWSPARLKQAEQRCDRIGQQDQVTKTYLLAEMPDGSETIDGQMWRRLENKIALISAAVDGDGALGQDDSVLAEVLGDLIRKAMAGGI